MRICDLCKKKIPEGEFCNVVKLRGARIGGLVPSVWKEICVDCMGKAFLVQKGVKDAT